MLLFSNAEIGYEVDKLYTKFVKIWHIYMYLKKSQIDYIIVVSIDITEQKKAAEAKKAEVASRATI